MDRDGGRDGDEVVMGRDGGHVRPRRGGRAWVETAVREAEEAQQAPMARILIQLVTLDLYSRLAVWLFGQRADLIGVGSRLRHVKNCCRLVTGVHIRDPLQKNLARRVQSSARLARSPKVPTGGVLRGVRQSDHFSTRRRGQERHRACRVRTRRQERRTASRRDTAVRGTPSWCNCCHLILELRTHLSGGWSYVRTYVRTSNRLFNREYVRTCVSLEGPTCGSDVGTYVVRCAQR